MKKTRLGFALMVGLAIVASAAPARAQERSVPPATEDERQQRLRALEEKVKVLAEEIESLKTKAVVPETTADKSAYGLGPAASKIYQLSRGLSIGGYGEASLTALVNDRQNRKNTVDFERFVLYTGYKFSDRILFNSELEVEHAKTEESVSAGAGSVEVEFAYLDFQLWEPLNARTGLLLIPMGFINEIHEPPFYFGNKRPEVERRIIPATWRELGAGFYGTLLPGLDYRTYVVNGLNAKGFSSEDFREARQEGNQAFAEDVAWTARLDYTPLPGLLVGASFFWGDSGQDQLFADRRVDANLFLYDLHAQFQYRGLHVRGVFAEGYVGDARTLSADLGDSISRRIWGAYGEVAYDLLPLFLPGTRQSLSPFVRVEWLDTQADVPSGFRPDRSKRLQINTVGLSYKPIPSVVLKLDYRGLNPDSGSAADEVNTGFGFAF